MSTDLVRLMLTIPSAAIIGIAVLAVFYGMVDGEIPASFGLVTVGLLLVTLYFCVWPPHLLVPVVALVAVVAGMICWPFFRTYLVNLEFGRMDADQLEKLLGVWQAKPDNVSAQLAVAGCLRDQGFDLHAINLAQTALSSASTRVDDLTNRSVRDVFRKEERALKSWEVDSRDAPDQVSCLSCGHRNGIRFVFCEKCEAPYLLALVRQADPGRSVIARLMVASTAVTFSLVCSASLGLMLDGWLRIFAVLLVVGAAGGIIHFVTKPTRPAYLGNPKR